MSYLFNYARPPAPLELSIGLAAHYENSIPLIATSFYRKMAADTDLISLLNSPCFSLLFHRGEIFTQ